MALNWFKKKNKPPEEETPAQQQKIVESGNLTSDQETSPSEEKEAPAAEAAEETLNDAPPIQPDNESSPLNGAADPSVPRKGLFARLKRGLAKTRDILNTDIEDLFSGRSQIDDDLLEELEELLITSDIGVQTAMDLIAAVQRQASKIDGPQGLKEALRKEIRAMFENIGMVEAPALREKPHVVMVVGVNGVGKTTTIGKLAARATDQGQSVLIAAADTFRAAAVEQLAIWAERAGADIVKHKENADPAAVAYDGIEAAVARGIDTVFVDTAGRLHTKVNLMEELKKIKRTIAKKIPDAPHEILLVLDATTGQNALSQAQLFNEAIGVTGLALTKLDGTAKGGIVISICQSLNLPLYYIGVGEGIEDLQRFDPRQFVEALF